MAIEEQNNGDGNEVTKNYTFMTTHIFHGKEELGNEQIHSSCPIPAGLLAVTLSAAGLLPPCSGGPGLHTHSATLPTIMGLYQLVFIEEDHRRPTNAQPPSTDESQENNPTCSQKKKGKHFHWQMLRNPNNPGTATPENISKTESLSCS
jgi:hypothetical protein